MLVTQSCPTLCDSMDCSPPGSSVRGILQARILEWVAIPFSRVSSRPRDWTQVSCTVRWVHCALSPTWHSTSATVRWPSPCTPPLALADATQQFLSLGHITTNYCSETSLTCWVRDILGILQSIQKCWTLNTWGVSLSKKWWQLTDWKALQLRHFIKFLWKIWKFFIYFIRQATNYIE